MIQGMTTGTQKKTSQARTMFNIAMTIPASISSCTRLSFCVNIEHNVLIYCIWFFMFLKNLVASNGKNSQLIISTVLVTRKDQRRDVKDRVSGLNGRTDRSRTLA